MFLFIHSPPCVFKFIYGLRQWEQICLQLFSVLELQMVYICISHIYAYSATEMLFVGLYPHLLQLNWSK